MQGRQSVVNTFNRIYELHQLLTSRRYPVSRVTLQHELECSESTVRRTVRQLRDNLGAPLVYDRQHNGYIYRPGENGPFELPGVWFSPQETHALLTAHQLLDNLQPGILSSHISSLTARLKTLLTQHHPGHADVGNRIRILQIAARPIALEHYRAIASAVVERRQLRILYHGRERDVTTERTVSPQRLIHYRSNWYLDAFCHLRNQLRSFALDRLQPIETLTTPAEDITDEKLDAHFTKSYGIFAGQPKHTAHLRFTPQAARWVADEQWHPQQQGKILSDGSYELHIPYSDPRELIMDILKYGPDVNVIGPAELREWVAEKLSAALNNYKSEK